MDQTQSIGLAGLVTSLAAISAYLIKLNHKRIRSKCCGKDCTTSLDVEDTTPTNSDTKEQLKITIPESK
jgi:hypothetical protein